MTFTGRRARRPALMWAGLLLLLVAAAGCASLVARRGEAGVRFVPWIALGAFFVFMGLMFLSVIPRPATLELSADELRPSWAAPVRRAGARVALGRWVMPAIDTPVGLALHIGGLRIGGTDHPGDGYTIDTRPQRAVDFELAAADFDALAAQLGVARAPLNGDLEVELVRNSQSGGAILRSMAPWLLTIAVVSVASVVLGSTGVAERLLRQPHGAVWLGAGTGGLVLLGLAWTVVRSMRARLPGLVLRSSADGLTLADYRGAEQLAVPWYAVRAEPRRLVLRTKGGTWTLPALALALGDRTLTIACWDPREQWGFEPPKASATWVAGRPHWRQLTAALRQRSLLRG